MTGAARRIEPVVFPLAGAAALAAALWVAYVFGPAASLALVLGACAVAVTLTKPQWGLVLAVLAIPLELSSVSLGGEAGVTLTEALLLVCAVGWVLRRLAENKAPVVDSPLTKPLGLMLLAVVPGLAVALEIFPVVKVLVMWTCFFFIYQMVVADGDERTVVRVLVALALSGGVVGLIAAITPAVEERELLQAGTLATGRAVGSFTHPNTLASFLSMALPAALALAIAGPVALRPAALASFAACMLGLSLSLSRGGLLGAAAALLVLLMWPPFRRVAAVAAVAAVAIAVASGASLTGSSQTVDIVAKRLESVSTSARGLDPRLTLWRETPTIIFDHPLVGIGANQFALVARREHIVDRATRKPYDHPHNILLAVTVELGILGLVGFVWLVVALAGVLARALRRRGPPRAFAFAVTASLVAVGVQGLFDYLLRSNVLGALVLILAGAAVVLGRPSPDEPAAAATP